MELDMKLITLLSLIISFSASAGIVRNTPIRCHSERYRFTLTEVMENLGVTPVQLIGERSDFIENSILTGRAGNSEFLVITYGADCRNLANTGELFSPVRYLTDAINAEYGADYAESLKLVSTDRLISESGIKVKILNKERKSATIVLEQPNTGFIIEVPAKRLR